MHELGRVLLTGATGFVGRHLGPALEAAGVTVRRTSRTAARARREQPDCEWAQLDPRDADSIRAALSGCDSACYLLHGVGSTPDYPAEEARAAEWFAQAARRANLRRLVYLGGVAPRGAVSRHLHSRLQTGRILRESGVPSVELRASMIIGHGSSSFEMVRNLATRLPVLPQPDWLLYRSCPVAIDDVVVALVATLLLPELDDDWYDLPGPEQLSHRNVVLRVASLLGQNLRMLPVPDLDLRPILRRLGPLTGIAPDLAAELLDGLRSDLVPEPGHSIWPHLPWARRRGFDAAVHDALLDRSCQQSPSPRTRDRLIRAAQDVRRRVHP
jgi:uncharacterized protein YbjT (DUF2867 family)